MQIEFDKFPGAILVTTNCVLDPVRTYKDRMFTTGATPQHSCGWHHLLGNTRACATQLHPSPGMVAWCTVLSGESTQKHALEWPRLSLHDRAMFVACADLHRK